MARLSSALVAMLSLSLSHPAGVEQLAVSRRVSVDGHEVHLRVAGSQGPTVVLEAGGRLTHRTWDQVQRVLADGARVVSYDRPGLGDSAGCQKPETARRVAAELREALRAAGLPPPYVLVGHSLGGAFVRVFARMYPDDVGGLVLLDPSQERFFERLRLEHPAVHAAYEQAPGTPKGAARDAFNVTMMQAAASDPPPAVPILLLTRSVWGDAAVPETSAMWTEEHRRWVGRTPTARLVVVPESGHMIHRDAPYAVIDAVREILRSLPAR